MLIDTFTKETKPAQITQAELLDLLCKTIAGNNMAYFDALLPQIEDLDAEQGRALLCCVEHDRFAMAKKLFLRGVASTIMLEKLQTHIQAKRKIYMDLPMGSDQEAHSELLQARKIGERLANWKKTFHEDILPVLAAQKMQEIEDKIDALREELAQATSPNRISLKKPTSPAAPPSRQPIKTTPFRSAP